MSINGEQLKGTAIASEPSVINMQSFGTWVRSRRLPSERLITTAGIGLGLLGGGLAAWLALEPGSWAVILLVVGFGLTVWGAGRHLRLVAAGYPKEVTVEPLPPGPRLNDDDEEEEAPGPSLDHTRKTKPAAPADEEPDPRIGMVPLPGGEFWMGSDRSSDPDALDDELPRRRVRLSPFAIGSTPVTRGLWRRVMAEAPSAWKRAVPEEWTEQDDDLPATHVSWFDGLAFCNALSLLSGRRPCYNGSGEVWPCDWSADGYRLPTEAEWEYACRAGTETRWFWGDNPEATDEHARYGSNSNAKLHPVRSKHPNAFGLYDMSGNCWEWRWDWYGDYEKREVQDPRGPQQGRLRVLRGGSFFVEPRGLRSANRRRSEPVSRGDHVGFRCVRSGARSSKP